MVKAPPPCKISLLNVEREPTPNVRAPPLMKIWFWFATVVPAKVLTPERVWLPVPCLVKVKRVGSKISSESPDLVAAAERVTVLAISSIAVTVVPLFTPAPNTVMPATMPVTSVMVTVVVVARVPLPVTRVGRLSAPE